MLSDLWPLYDLAIHTQRLVLRIPREEEVADLAQLAADGMHPPHERPFLTPWTDGSPQDRARGVLQGHWEALGAWDVANWRLALGIFVDGRPVGSISLRARDFPVVREVTTSSWLGLPHHSQGFGTEARAGVLTLAFEHLGAEAALSEVFQDNHASQAVSRKLGYRHDGISRDARGTEVLVSDRLRLDRRTWEARERPSVEVTGIAPARSMFGLEP